MQARKKRLRVQDQGDARAIFHNRAATPRDLALKYGTSVRTIYRWVNAGEGGQVIDPPESHPNRSRPRKYAPEVFARIVALKEEAPRRTAVGILVILRQEFPGKVPSVSTVRKFLAVSGLRPGDPAPRKGYVKFERKKPNDLWQLDIDGVQTVGHLGKLYLVAILDDCSRFIVAARYFPDQAGVHVLKVLRDAVIEHGCPNQVVTDNGRQFRNAIGELGTRYTRLLEVLGVQPVFARPSHPQTKGKLERWFGTVRSGFLLDARLAVERDPTVNLGAFNALFGEWLRRYNLETPHRSLPGHCPPAQVYFHAADRVHRPLQVIVDWNQWVNTHLQRKVTKYNLISFKGESLAVPPGYAGCKVDVVELEATVEIYHRDNLLVSHPVDPARFLPGRETKSRKVAHNGIIQYKGKYLTVGYKLAGQVVEVWEASAGTELLVYLGGVLLKKFAL